MHILALPDVRNEHSCIYNTSWSVWLACLRSWLLEWLFCIVLSNGVVSDTVHTDLNVDEISIIYKCRSRLLEHSYRTFVSRSNVVLLYQTLQLYRTFVSRSNVVLLYQTLQSYRTFVSRSNVVLLYQTLKGMMYLLAYYVCLSFIIFLCRLSTS